MPKAGKEKGKKGGGGVERQITENEKTRYAHCSDW
jgi:hypothetical protein